MKDFFKTAYFKYIVFGLLVCAFPFLAEAGIMKASQVTIIGFVIFYAIAAMGLNILLGYSGLISLGSAGFMGLAAYLSAYLTEDMNMNFVLAMVLSVGIPMLLSVLIGLTSLRLEGFYLAIATLGFSEILRQIFVEFEWLTNGFSGKKANYPNFFGFAMDKNMTFILMAVTLVVLLILTYNFINSATGRAFLGMRGSETAAQAMGISLFKYKLMAFTVSTMFISIAGVFYTHFIKYAYPSTWNVGLSLQIVAVIVIGGMRRIEGPIIGSFIVFGVPELILKNLPVISKIDGLTYQFSGLLIIGVVLFYPKGLINIKDDIMKMAKRKKTAAAEIEATEIELQVKES